MKKGLIIFGLLAVVVAAAVVFLATLPIPAPSQTIEKTLDNDRFPNS